LKDIDKMLIGTVWSRAIGTHSKATGSIDDLSPAGPRLKLKDGSHRRLHWGELDFGWKPDDKKSEDRYTLWQLANRADYLEKKERELVQQNGSAPIMTDPETAVRECHGPWHRHGKEYELVPLSSFAIATRGPNTGKLSSVCRDCAEKHRLSNERSKAAKSQPQTRRAGKRLFIAVSPESIEIEPTTVTETGVVYRWKVTVVQPTEHYVQAKDFLDAAAQVASLGEVTKVEKL
jgi:hypothetical protein